MAALLIEIKSRMLLPPPASEPGAEEADPRAELVRRLLEYEKIKLGASQLNTLAQLGRDFFKAQVLIEQSLKPRFATVHGADLQAAWQDILQRAKLVKHHTLSREALSVREYMSHILRQLRNQRFIEFSELFEPKKGLPVLIVLFVALLELAKEGLVEVTQAELYAPIYLRLAHTAH
jgi:segregation and condensation protein A